MREPIFCGAEKYYLSLFHSYVGYVLNSTGLIVYRTIVEIRYIYTTYLTYIYILA
jgi:hypothetical protein